MGSTHEAAAIHSELSGDKFRVLEERMRMQAGVRSALELAQPKTIRTTSTSGGGDLAHCADPASTTPAMAKRVRSPSDGAGSSGGGGVGCAVGGRAVKPKGSADLMRGAQITDFYATSLMATPQTGGGVTFAPPPRHAHTQTEPLAEEGEMRKLKEALASAQRQARFADESLEPLRAELARVKALELRGREQTITWLRKLCRLEKAAAREAATRNSAHLGTVGWQRVGHNMSEVWEPGNAFRELHVRQAEVLAQREAIDRDRRALTGAAKRRAGALTSGAAAGAGGVPDADAANAGAAGAAADVGAGGMAGPIGPAEREEVLRLKAATLKRQEAALSDEAARIERDKQLHIRELKRIRDEDGSRFSAQQLLGERYLLLELLGRGGFSEVFRAYDLHDHREVACKIHQLSPHWSDERKANYTRHATREYAIHKALSHDRIVALYDVFEIDAHTFATVLQFCNGGDLDALLKEQRTLPEKEARAIIYQVFSGLHYLTSQRQRVIHYDLKPGNILFHDGEVKLTDFGLSKLMDESTDPLSGMELTSQGAGTYWYLPPECFEVSKGAPPKICSKVDVWSAGVVFFQMLFGRKPFGDDMSQESLLTTQTMRNALLVEFPSKPAVSHEAKEFLRRCLAHSRHERPDLLTVFGDAYLAPSGAKRGA